MPHRRRVAAIAATVFAALALLGLGASPASAADQQVVLNVQINGAPPAGLSLQVQLNCSPRGVPPNYVFTGAGTQTIDVTGSGNCAVNVFDTSGQSTSIGVSCAVSAPTVTCTSESSAVWDLTGTVGGTATFTIVAQFPAATTTTTESTTTTSSTTTTTTASTTTSGTAPTTTSSTIATTTTTVAGDSSGSSSNLVWFILAGLAFLAVLGTLLWYLFGRKDDANGPGDGNGGSGPGAPSGPVPGAPGSMAPGGPPTTAMGYAPPGDPNAPAWGPPPDTTPPSTPPSYGSPGGTEEPPPTVANPGLS